MTLLKEIATRKDAISSLPALETAAFDKRAQRGERYQLLLGLIAAHQALGNHAEQLEAAKELVRIAKTPEAFLYLGFAYRFCARPEEAFKWFKKAYFLPHDNKTVVGQMIDHAYATSMWENGNGFRQLKRLVLPDSKSRLAPVSPFRILGTENPRTTP
jgi:tetratricopeptide (TPR) repeat protein